MDERKGKDLGADGNPRKGGTIGVPSEKKQGPDNSGRIGSDGKYPAKRDVGKNVQRKGTKSVVRS